ncbi:MAG: orotate phosphoribosyltransferase [Candidatus Bipolaricaulota bacterium]
MSRRWHDLFVRRNALLEGHFLLSSGRHSPAYVQCAKVLERPEDAEALGRALAGRTPGASVDRVIAPPMGGILIGYEVARALGVPFLFPERDASGALSLRRGFTLEPGDRVLVVEDVVTTGITTGEVLRLVQAKEASPVGLLALVDRSEDHRVDVLPVHAILQLQIPTYAPEECPLCAEDIPLTKPGSRVVLRGRR